MFAGLQEDCNKAGWLKLDADTSRDFSLDSLDVSAVRSQGPILGL